MKQWLRIAAILLCIFLLLGCTPATSPEGTEGEDPPTGETPKELTAFVHFSFDDVEHCFRNLRSNAYASIWEEPFLAMLKTAHDTLGMKISLYTWKDVLHDQPTAYRAEWQACADWLRIGLHADGDGNFANATYEEGRAAWEHFVADVYAMTGTYAIVDRIPRLHNFAGSGEALRGMRDATCGALGFLAADDTRISYSLPEEGCLWLQENDYLRDAASDLIYLTTDIRCERYRAQSMYITLSEMYGLAPSADCYILFTHEYEIYDGKTVNENLAWITEAAFYFKERGIPFAFPADFTYPTTEGDVPAARATPA